MARNPFQVVTAELTASRPGGPSYKRRYVATWLALGMALMCSAGAWFVSEVSPLRRLAVSLLCLGLAGGTFWLNRLMAAALQAGDPPAGNAGVGPRLSPVSSALLFGMAAAAVALTVLAVFVDLSVVFVGLGVVTVLALVVGALVKLRRPPA